MKFQKIILIVAAVLALLSVRSQALTASIAPLTVTITLESAQLQTSGSAPIPNGALIQLLGDTSTNFGAPTVGDFEGTDPDETLLWSGTAYSGTLGIAGSFRDAITLTLDSSGEAQGYLQSFTGADLLMRWFPTLTGTSTAASLVNGTTYGQFRTSALENSSNIEWAVPTSGNYNLNYVNAAEGGAEPTSTGVASYVVEAVPEPNSMVAMVAGVGGMLLFLRRRS